MLRSKRSLLLALGGAALVVVPATSAAFATASPLNWGARVPADTTDGLRSVSCPSTTLCVAGAAAQTTATGTIDHVATSTDPGNPAAWTVVPIAVPAPAGSIVSMSCPAAGLCIGVDDFGHILSSTDPTGGAAAWRVATFQRPPPATGNRGFSSVSCATVALCVAIDRGGNAVLSSTAPASGVWNAVDTPGTWGGVSCTAPSLCVATSGSNVFTSTTPGGNISAWTQARVVPSGSGGVAQGQLSGPACIPSACVVADQGNATVGNGTWSASHPLDGAAAWTRIDSAPVDRLTCVQGSVASLCAGWSSFGGFVTATAAPTGSAADWVATEAVADTSISDQIADVSCPTVAMCVAVTAKGSAVLGTGTGAAPPPGNGVLPPPSGATPPSGIPSPTVGGSPAPARSPSSGYPGAGLLGNDVYAVTGNAVSFLLTSPSDASGTLAATTQSAYAAAARAARASHARPARRRVKVGSARFKLKARVKKHVRLVLSRPARRLLAREHRLKVRLTITVRTTKGVRRVTTHTVTLKRARR